MHKTLKFSILISGITIGMIAVFLLGATSSVQAAGSCSIYESNTHLHSVIDQYNTNHNQYLDRSEIGIILSDWKSNQLSLSSDEVLSLAAFYNNACQIPQQEDPVSGTLSINKTTATTGEDIKLTITAQDDQGLQRLWAYYHNTWHAYSVSGTSASYTWTFTEATPGTYTYRGWVVGTKVNGTAEGSYTTPVSVQVVVSQPVTHGVISGTVTDDQGNPIAGAVVKTVLYPQTTCNSYGQAITDANGHYEISGLTTGYYVLRAEKSDYVLTNPTGTACQAYYESKYGKGIICLSLGAGNCGPTQEQKTANFVLAPKVKPSITVLSPKRGEKWVIGKTYTIRWKSQGIDTVLIELDRGNQGWHLAYNIDASLGQYSWTIPSSITPANDYKIKVIGQGSAAGIEDASDGYFSILSPTTCSDSDGGLNYYTQGKVTSCNLGMTLICNVLYDSCQHNGNLREYYCDGQQAKYVDYTCPYGCGNGACLKEAKKPDLTITNISFTPTEPRVGDKLYSYITIKNIGSKTASDIGVSLVDQKGWGNSTTISSLEPGESETVTLTLWTTDIHATYNPHRFVAKVDYLNQIDELNESNNTLVKNITVLAKEKPDLVVTKAEFSSNDYKLYYTVANEGSALAGPSQSFFTVNGNRGGTDNIAAISAGASLQSHFDTWSCSPGQTYRIGICADWNNKVVESNDGNNCYNTTLKCPGGHEDLVSGTLSVDKTTAKTGENITLTISAQDEQGVAYVLAYYQGKWHTKSCNGTSCTKTFIFSESTPGIKYYYGYLYGKKLNGSLEGAYTKPVSVKVNIIRTNQQFSITVLSPNGGERWVIGKTYTIKWKASNLDKVIIWLRDYSQGNNFKACRLTPDYVNATIERYSWTIGADDCSISPGDRFKIAVSEPEGNAQPRRIDTSDNYFSIINPSQQENPVSGTISVDKTTAKTGENITLTVSARDKQGVTRVAAWYQNNWHIKYCSGTSCTKTFTFSESTPGTKYYYGYVYGRKLSGTSEGSYTTPMYVSVTVSSPSSATCTDTDGGANYYTKGQSYSSNSNIEGRIDCCKLYYSTDMGDSVKHIGPGGGACVTSGPYLYEAICGADGNPTTVVYKCPNGCYNGACIAASSRADRLKSLSSMLASIQGAIDNLMRKIQQLRK